MEDQPYDTGRPLWPWLLLLLLLAGAIGLFFALTPRAHARGAGIDTRAGGGYRTTRSPAPEPWTKMDVRARTATTTTTESPRWGSV